MNQTIDEKALESLRDAMHASDGSLTDPEIEKIVGKGNVEDYLAELSVKWPDEFPPAEAEEEEPEPEKAAPASVPKPVKEPVKKQAKAPSAGKSGGAPSTVTRAVLQLEDGTSRELELVAVTGKGVAIVKEKAVAPPENVMIVLKGHPREVDLNMLRAQPPGSQFEGLPVSTVIAIAEAAKA